MLSVSIEKHQKISPFLISSWHRLAERKIKTKKNVGSYSCCFSSFRSVHHSSATSVIRIGVKRNKKEILESIFHEPNLKRMSFIFKTRKLNISLKELVAEEDI
jgi:hypothetical protein